MEEEEGIVDGVMVVVVVVGMEEEMEEEEVEKLMEMVVEMEVEKVENGWPIGGSKRLLAVGGSQETKKKMKE